MMLTDNDLEYMRGIIAELLPDTCNILSLTRTADGMGGFTETWGTVTANIACRLDPVRAREEVAGMGLQPFRTYQLTLSHDQTISEAQRIEHGGYTYAVMPADSGKSWQASNRTLVERI